MNFKAYFFKKYGILIKESESSYLNYLFEKHNDYNKVLNEFSSNCTTRYFNNKNIKEIRNDMLKEELGRNKHNKGGDVSNSDNGNITDDKILADQGLYVEETADTMSGEDSIYIELDIDGDKKSLYKPMDNEYTGIYKRNIRNINMNN